MGLDRMRMLSAAASGVLMFVDRPYAKAAAVGLLGILLCLRVFKWLFLHKPIKGSVAFFHPFTNDGGGGERVLWCAVRALQEEHPNAKVRIYSGDDLSSSQLMERAAGHFGVTLPRPVEVVRLRRRRWVLPESYPRLTLIGQSLGSVVLAFEALRAHTPQVFIDTAGFAFTFPLAALAGCEVATYVHYPTISTDMLRRVKSREGMYNNDADIAASPVKSYAKLVYYYAFAFLYCLAGSFADVVMVNSNWTGGHIRRLWGWGGCKPSLVFPPCDTASLLALPLARPAASRYLISVAQFRPEKAHRLQLEALAAAREAAAAGGGGGEAVLAARLKLVGSCRHDGDAARIEALKAAAGELGVAAHVDFCVNVPYSELQALLGGATAGLHTMVDEHFGISVVEYMAAGVVPIAHNSGGPKEDIVCEEGGRATGYLAATVPEYATAIAAALSMGEARRVKMARAGRARAGRFSEQEFTRGFKKAMECTMKEGGEY